jgi:hypothetical protein
MQPVGVIAVLAVASCAAAVAPHVAAERKTPQLRTLAEYELKGARSPALDLRWATGNSVLIATSLDQVAEHRLEVGLPTARQLYPSPPRFDPFTMYGRLGVSQETVVVGEPTRRISWRPLAPNPGGSVLYERQMLGHIEDLDLDGDRLAWIGWPEAVNHSPWPDHPDYSGVAWLARPSALLAAPKRMMSDVAGSAPGQHLMGCILLGNGALRFQPDGSLLVAPGFLDEIVLLDPAGRQLQRWDARWFGIDTAAHCTTITEKERLRLDMEPRASQEWANRHQVIDEALATPKGPAIVVRRLGPSGLPAWRLHVLGRAGVESFDLPVQATSPFDRLAGDVRGSKLALLVGDQTSYPRAGAHPDRVIVVALP